MSKSIIDESTKLYEAIIRLLKNDDFKLLYHDYVVKGTEKLRPYLTSNYDHISSIGQTDGISRPTALEKLVSISNFEQYIENVKMIGDRNKEENKANDILDDYSNKGDK